MEFATPNIRPKFRATALSRFSPRNAEKLLYVSRNEVGIAVSVSRKILSAGQAATLSGLAFAPNETENPALSNCDMAAGLPRKPWTIHIPSRGISLEYCSSRSAACTQCMSMGIPSLRDIAASSEKACFCCSTEWFDVRSKPHSPMAAILPAWDKRPMRRISSCRFEGILQGCIPTE